MRNINAVFSKQLKETLKNKTMLLQFLMFPVMTLVMENAMPTADMTDHFFAKMFSVMFTGMAPLTCMSSIISEEKEKNTLRALMMSNVRPFEYLVGVGLYVWLLCMGGAVVFALAGGYEGMDFCVFMLITAAGILLSELMGAVIGIFSKDQMAASSTAIPVMSLFSFLPLLAMFNESFEKIAKFTFSQQISILVNGLGSAEIKPESILVIAANFIVSAVLFVLVFRKKGLE